MRQEEKITEGCFQITKRNVKHFLHSSSDGSWQETTADEIKRLIIHTYITLFDNAG